MCFARETMILCFALRTWSCMELAYMVLSWYRYVVVAQATGLDRAGIAL